MTKSLKRTTSAAGIQVPNAPSTDRLGDLRGATAAEIESADREAVYDRLRELIAKFRAKPNKHVMVYVLIGTAISQGVTDKSNIICILN